VRVWFTLSLTVLALSASLAIVFRELLDAADASDFFSLSGILAAGSLLICCLTWLWLWAT
jgi:hypothetical protein